MRRVVVLLFAVFLVNLPFVHEALAEREVARDGRPAVAEVLATRSVGGRRFVDYRLPVDLDPARVRYSARVEDAIFETARDTGRLPVRVVPGSPAVHRVEGAVVSRIFRVVALAADLVLLLGGAAYWRRRRRWRLHEVVSLEEGTAVLHWRELTLTAAVPAAWAARVRPGDQVPGSLHLLAEADVLPQRAGSAPEGLEQVRGPAYVVRGRVRDARAGVVELDVGEGLVLRVETGPHRIRADLRDQAEVSGTLTFDPS